MPFVVARTNAGLSRKQKEQLKDQLGKAMALVPGKSARDMLLTIEDGASMWLAGEGSKPMAYVDAALFGTEDHAGYDMYTAAVSRAFAEVVGIEPDRVFVRVGEIGAWSCGERYVDRRWFA